MSDESDAAERAKNLLIFKVPLTDAEMGLDKPMPNWLVCVVIGVILAILIGVGFLMTR